MSNHVLIVDDSRLARKMLKDSLPVDCSFVIGEARNGLEALEFCRKNPVDLMFLDLTMPKMDGYQLLEAMQKEDRLPCVVVVSADIQPKAQERVLHLGAKSFIGKPINPEEVVSCLKEQGFL